VKRIYKVNYEERWTGCREWMADSTNVLANGDAQQAIDRVKKQSLSNTYKDEKGKLQKCIGFRLREIEVLAEAC
jgi:hypothetical protein